MNLESLGGKEEATKTVEVLAVISRTRTDQAEIAKIIANRKEEAAHLNLAVEAIATGSPKTTREALELVKSDNEEYAGMAQGYGFQTCGPS
jgi:hypothetical protein